MNVECMGATDLSLFADQSLKDAKALGIADDSKGMVDVGGVLESGFTAAGNILTSLFTYKTAQLKSGQTGVYRSPTSDPDTTQTSSGSNGTKTALIVGGSVLAGIIAIAALK